MSNIAASPKTISTITIRGLQCSEDSDTYTIEVGRSQFKIPKEAVQSKVEEINADAQKLMQLVVPRTAKIVHIQKTTANATFHHTNKAVSHTALSQRTADCADCDCHECRCECACDCRCGGGAQEKAFQDTVFRRRHLTK